MSAATSKQKGPSSRENGKKGVHKLSEEAPAPKQNTPTDYKIIWKGWVTIRG